MSRRFLHCISALVVLGVASCGSNDEVREEVGDAVTLPPVISHFTVRGRWDDPRRITYLVEDRAGPLDHEQWHAAITRACDAWNATGLVKFVAAELSDEADVTLGWRRGHHGACKPFGMDSSVAHSGPVQSGTFVHFDAGRVWTEDASDDNSRYSVYGTALHELGHILGLGHSSAADAIMRTGVVRSVPLAASDLFGLQSIYGGGIDAVGDLRIEAAASGKLLTALRGVAPSGISDYAVFDVDGNGSDDLLVWRTDLAGDGRMMVYHFAGGGKLVRTSGPMIGVMAPDSRNMLIHAVSGDRILLTEFANGRRIARRFDKYGALQAYSVDQLSDQDLKAAESSENLRIGDLDGDSSQERVVAVSRGG